MYFIHDAASQAVKIGVAVDVPKRVGMLQVGNPNPLRLVGSIPGGVTQERRLHREFKHLKIRGEWFRAIPELMDRVNTLVEEFGESCRDGSALDDTYSSEWCAKMFNTENGIWVLQATVRRRVYQETGILTTAFWINNYPLSSAPERLSYQIMPDVGLGGEFFGWHLDNNPQFYRSVGEAADAFIKAFRCWHEVFGSGAVRA